MEDAMRKQSVCSKSQLDAESKSADEESVKQADDQGRHAARERASERGYRPLFFAGTALSKCLRLPRVFFLFDVDTVSYFPLSFPQNKITTV
jgi:hypothetical protein